jgi:hypothetical protein
VAIAEYNDRAKGPAKDRVMAAFVQEKMVANMLAWGKFVAGKFRELSTSMQSQIDETKRELAATRGQASAAEQISSNQKEMYEKRLSEAAMQLADERARLREEVDNKQLELERTNALMDRHAVTHR